VLQILLLVWKHDRGDLWWWVAGSALVWAVAALIAYVPVAVSSIAFAAGVALIAAIAGVRDLVPIIIIFSAGFALAANTLVALRGFRAGWKHGVAYLGHLGASLLLIGVISSSGYGRSVQVQLPQGQQRTALGLQLTFEGVQPERSGKDRVAIAVAMPGRTFEARPALFWSEYNQGYMKKPHIERFLTHDLYISPLEIVGEDANQGAVWLAKGESKKVGQVTYTFIDFDRQMGTDKVTVAARLRAEIGGRTVPVRPVLEMNMKSGIPNRIPDYLPGGASVQIASVDPTTGRVALEVPGASRGSAGNILAVEVSTKPLINLVWIGAIVMLASALMSVLRRVLDLRKSQAEAGA
jgi:cytochrome c-type biogenesis protein CcmF